MNNQDSADFAFAMTTANAIQRGLTKREWIAGQVLAGIAAPLMQAAGEAKEDLAVFAKTVAGISVALTDALLAELAKVSP